MDINVSPSDGLILSILVLFLGQFLTGRIQLLKKYNIPTAVTGGLICSLVIAIVYFAGGPKITFDMSIRDQLLLAFFTTIGLSAKAKVLKSGGRALAVLVLIASAFLVIQDITGVLIVWLMGYPPGYGLFGGSISFAGGYGTAIAWGEMATEAGYRGAQEIGIACATFGLIAGSLIGGPIAKNLIAKNKIEPNANNSSNSNEHSQSAESEAEDNSPICVNAMLGTLLALGVCYELGDLVNRYLGERDVMLPGFLTAMLAGIILTNMADIFKIKMNKTAINLTSDVSLQLFLGMSLMSIQLWTLTEAMGPLLIVLWAQVTVMTIYAVFVVFRFMGKDYDSCVIASGFAGLGLGATPVAIANMSAITEKYGPSPKAFLVIPLVGAFFIDIVNSMVIKMFISLSSISG